MRVFRLAGPGFYILQERFSTEQLLPTKESTSETFLAPSPQSLFAQGSLLAGNNVGQPQIPVPAPAILAPSKFVWTKSRWGGILLCLLFGWGMWHWGKRWQTTTRNEFDWARIKSCRLVCIGLVWLIWGPFGWLGLWPICLGIGELWYGSQALGQLVTGRSRPSIVTANLPPAGPTAV